MSCPLLAKVSLPYQKRPAKRGLSFRGLQMAQTKAEIAAYMRAWRETHREEIAAYLDAHREEKIASWRAYREAHREERRVADRAYRAAHREERLAYGRVYHVRHLEEERAYSRAWTKAHPQQAAEKARRRDARKRGATIGPIDFEAIKKRDRMLCCICGKKVFKKPKDPMMRLSFDHSHPLVLHGPHSQENQRVAHLRCNVKRGAGRLPVQMVLL